MVTTPQLVEFADIARLIVAARQQATRAVNTALIDLYWGIGERISRKIASAEWGDGVVEQLARYLAQTEPGLRGFTRSNLFRMRQFYEVYAGNEIVAALLRQLSWTHHLIILGQSKRPEEREFYLRLAAQEQWSSRAAMWKPICILACWHASIIFPGHPHTDVWSLRRRGGGGTIGRQGCRTEFTGTYL